MAKIPGGHFSKRLYNAGVHTAPVTKLYGFIDVKISAVVVGFKYLSRPEEQGIYLGSIAPVSLNNGRFFLCKQGVEQK
jgi:hypothetical protein